MSRIYLDNFTNVQSSWVTQGPEIGQVALKYGANDLGSIMIEENVVSQAGTTFRMGVADMQRLIQRPRLRTASARQLVSAAQLDSLQLGKDWWPSAKTSVSLRSPVKNIFSLNLLLLDSP